MTPRGVSICAICILQILRSLAVAESATSTLLYNSTKTIDYILPTLNTIAASGVDPRFDIGYTFDTPVLPVTPCLMNALAAVSELAVEDFTGNVTPRTYTLTDYPSVSIVTDATVTSKTIEIRFVLWGIWKGIQYMISRNNFRNALLTLMWKGALVGYVFIIRSGTVLGIIRNNDNPTLSQRSDVSSTSDNTANLSKLNRSMIMTYPADEATLAVSFTFGGGTLTIYEVFFTVLSALASLAETPRDRRLRHVSLSPEHYNTTLAIFAPREAPQTSAPILNCEKTLVAMAMIPRFMVQRSDYREVVIIIRENGILIGKGFMERGRV
ncbi:hypothetical protein N7G274_008795 [Stereocaulon virgatum]|uniref:Uncharacterized protein n=1 Tax=Stereocaulon virgatum TaxID=373712 RepID=A0ABR3ZZL3_9LECA